jgi:RND family efflux transporter MFP subunit
MNEPPPTAPTNRLRNIGFISLALVIVGATVGIVPRRQQQTALRAETLELAVPIVAVVSPTHGQAGAGIALPAEIKPWLDAPIHARASGYLKQRCADIGAHVTNGQLLAEIDAPEVEQDLARARAELAQAEAALVLAKKTSERWAALLKSSDVSDQEAAEKLADYKLKAASVEASKAALRRLDDMLAFTRVTAPFDGIVTARNTDLGDLITAAAGKELFRVAQTTKLRVFVRVPQTLARAVAPGQSAELTIPEMPRRVFPAKIVRNSGAMSADSRTLLTELEVDNAANEILAGSFAQLRFTEAKLDTALTVPANTLLFRAEGTQVGVVQTGDKVELRSVKLGRDFGAVVEILDGLAATDRVIVNPPDSLLGGAQVRVAAPTKK